MARGSGSRFGGAGLCGNGAAMRVAPAGVAASGLDQVADLARCVQADQVLSAQRLKVPRLEPRGLPPRGVPRTPARPPRTRAVPIGAVTAADISDQERQMIARLTRLASLGRDHPELRPDPDEVLRGPTKFRGTSGDGGRRHSHLSETQTPSSRL